jgi:hypothetical protein
MGVHRPGETMSEMRTLLGMSLQRALLGEVTPSLRGVGVRVGVSRVEVGFFYDGDVSHEDRDTASRVEAELLADLPPEFKVVTDVRRVDGRGTLPEMDLWVYRRQES